MRKPKEKGPLGRLGQRWKDYIKLDLQEVRRWAGTRWIWLKIGTGGRHL